MPEKEKLSAVHDDDLIELLIHLDMFEDLSNKKIRCWFCKDIVVLESLHVLFPFMNDIKVSCNKPECVKKLSHHPSEL